jgi:hypothetical protein
MWWSNLSGDEKAGSIILVVIVVVFCVVSYIDYRIDKFFGITEKR